MTEMIPLTMAQYTIVTGILSSSDVKNINRVNTLTLCFEWEKGSEELLQKIGNWLLEHNDAFRLIPMYKFPWKWKQYIKPYEKEIFPVLHFENETQYEAWLKKEKNNDIRLLKDPLYDFKILVRPDGGYTFWMQMHHFITDGYSLKLIANQVRALNQYFTKGTPLLMPHPNSYTEYVKKEKEYRKSEQYKDDRAYWKDVFRYRKDYSFPAGSRSMKVDSDSQFITIDKRLYHKLLTFCKENKLSVSSVLNSTAATVVYALKGATYFSMATLSYGRHDGKTRHTMGCMMTSPVIMYDIEEEKSFTDFCRKNYVENIEMLRHVRYSNIDFTPLSYVLCTLHGMNYNHSWMLLSHMDYESAFINGEPRGRMFWSDSNISQFYAAIFDLPKEENVKIELRYQTNRFARDEIIKLLSASVNILKAALNEPDKSLEELFKVKVEG